MSGPIAVLLDKVALHPTRVADRDVEAAMETGLREDEIFELVLCAALGQATRRYEGANAAMDQALTGDGKRHAP